MFYPASRYYPIENASLTLANTGRNIVYKKRRFIPPDPAVTLQEITVSAGDRLDNISARTLGDPEQYWRICDINGNTMHPAELTEKPGRMIRIPVPGSSSRR
jgi:hypothetical protein